MRGIFSVSAVLLVNFLMAQNNFEGIFSVEYQNENKEISVVEVRVKDQLIYLKNTRGGVARYDHYLMNLSTREFQAVSTASKKVVMKFDIDKLMDIYEKDQLKEGFKV